MFFINYILFLLIILFTHIIALSTQLLSSKKYFFGVYINEITLEEELKNKINKDFKVKLNISLILSIIIYLILKNVFKLNMVIDTIISITIYLTFFFFILKLEYKKVKHVKNSYLLKMNINVEKETKQRRIINEDEVLSLNEILQRFFDIINPFALNYQGNDFGTQYRSGIYAKDSKILEKVRSFIQNLQKNFSQEIVTEVMELKNFYPAESYHQKYLAKNPNGYCHIDLSKALQDNYIP